MKQIYLSILILLLNISMLYSQNQTEYEKAQNYLQQKGEVYFKFQITSKAEISQLTRIISIDNVKSNNEVFAYANSNEFNQFISKGYNYTVLRHPGDLLEKPTMFTSAEKGIWQFDTYPTYDEYITMMTSFATSYPNLCKIEQIGTSVNGRKLLFAKISDNVNTREQEPRFMYTSSMHGDETTGYILMLRMINYLLTNYGTNTQVSNLVNNMEIWIMPLENPDGTFFGGNNTIDGSIRYNANLVDLNRNYKNPVDGDHPDNRSWQPEVLAMMNLTDSLHFVMSANFHGGAELVNYPWDSWISTDKIHADDNWWQKISTAYADTVHANADTGYLTDLNNGVTNGGDWYIATGSRQDYMTYYKSGREFCLEISAEKTLSDTALLAHWNYNYRSLLNYMEQAMYGIKGIVTDACTGLPMVAKVFVNAHDVDSSHVYTESTLGDYYRPILAGTYSLTFSALGYQSKTITNVVVPDNNATTLNVVLDPVAPVANFIADDTTNCSGLVNFTCLTGGVTSWLWNFGDGTTSTEQNPTHSYLANGYYNVTLTVVNCVNNDQEIRTNYVNINLASLPITNSTSRCGTGVVSLSATGLGDLKWYDAAVYGNLVNTGTTFITPNLNTSTTYYVESQNVTLGTSQYLGSIESSTNGGAYFNASRYLIFDSYTTSRLVSVEINPQTANANFSIQLQNSAGTVLQTKSFTGLLAGIQRVTLDFDIPVENNLRLVLSQSSVNFYRNNSGVTYPYTIAGLLSIKASSSTQSLQNYYYFYNWEVKTIDYCNSARVPVIATINDYPSVIITSTNVSAIGASDGTATASISGGSTPYIINWSNGATTNSLTELSEGVYYVTISDYNNCEVIDTAYITTLAGVDEALCNFYIYPNPTVGLINIETKLIIDRIELINTMGEIIYIDLSNKKMLDISGFPKGLYFIKLYYSNKIKVKIIVFE